MRVTFLGTGTSSGVPVIGCRCAVCTSPDIRNNRYRASILMQWNGRNIVIDTGPEFRLQVLRAGLKSLDAVLVTHEHTDHIVGLDDVRFFTLRGATLPLYATARTAAYVRSIFPYIFGSPVTPGTFRPSIKTHDIEGPFELFGETVVPVQVLHGDLPIIGFRVGEFAYVTDCSAMPDEAVERLKGVNTLVLGALRKRPHPTHFTLQEAIEAANRVGPRRTLFTHLGHEIDHDATAAELPEGFSLAWDGLTLETDDPAGALSPG